MNVSYHPARVCERCKCRSLSTLDIRPNDQLLCDDCWLGSRQQERVLVEYLCNTDFVKPRPAAVTVDNNKMTLDTEIDGGSDSMKSMNMDLNDEDSQNEIEDNVSGISFGRDTLISDAFSETSEH